MVGKKRYKIINTEIFNFIILKIKNYPPAKATRQQLRSCGLVAGRQN